MKWSDLGLAKKLRLPIATVGILLLVLSVLQITDMERISHEFSHINEEYIPGIELVLNADRDLYQAQIAERSIALGLSDPRYLKMHRENIQQVEDRVNKIVQLDISQAIISDAKQFLLVFNQWRPKTQDLVEKVKDQRISIEQATQISTDTLDKEFESIRDKLDVIGEQLGLEATALQQHTVETKNQALSNTVILVLVAIFITVCVAVFFPRMIIGPLNNLSKSLDELASGKGD